MYHCTILLHACDATSFSGLDATVIFMIAPLAGVQVELGLLTVKVEPLTPSIFREVICQGRASDTERDHVRRYSSSFFPMFSASPPPLPSHPPFFFSPLHLLTYSLNVFVAFLPYSHFFCLPFPLSPSFLRLHVFAFSRPTTRPFLFLFFLTSLCLSL